MIVHLGAHSSAPASQCTIERVAGAVLEEGCAAAVATARENHSVAKCRADGGARVAEAAHNMTYRTAHIAVLRLRAVGMS